MMMIRTINCFYKTIQKPCKTKLNSIAPKLPFSSKPVWHDRRLTTAKRFPTSFSLPTTWILSRPVGYYFKRMNFYDKRNPFGCPHERIKFSVFLFLPNSRSVRKLLRLFEFSGVIQHWSRHDHPNDRVRVQSATARTCAATKTE